MMQKQSTNIRILLMVIILFGLSFSLPADHRAQSLSSTAGNEPLIFYLNGTKVQRIYKSPLAGQKSKPIPNQLIIAPGIYRFAGGSYDLQKEGLYRFLLPEKMNLQRIVYENDIDSFLSAISWIHSHGNSDNKKSMEELTEKAVHSKLLITCGVISLWGRTLLADRHIKSRLVAAETLEKWNSYDDGHALIEVWRNKWHKWVLYDLDNSKYFINRQSGIPMSLIEFVNAVADKDDYEIIYTSLTTSCDVGNFRSPDGYDYAFYMEAILSNIRQWYQRVMQVPLIYDDAEKTYFFYDIAFRQRVKSDSNYRFIARRAFMKKFYPNVGARTPVSSYGTALFGMHNAGTRTR